MKTKIIFALLILTLTACTPAVATAPTVATSIPTTATLIVPTPYPSLVLPIFTPNSIQLARWQEYQLELAKVLLAGYPTNYNEALCEWDILGRSDLEVYVWASCETNLVLQPSENVAQFAKLRSANWQFALQL